MKRLHSKIMLAVLFSFLLAGAAQADNISGPILNTMIITGTNRLTGDVTCQVPSGYPCIQFGADNTELNLNGFVVRGDLVSPSDCFTGQTAIDTNQYKYAKVRGPGIITLFSGDAVDVTGSNSDVDHVAITFVGRSGIVVGGASGVRNTVLLNSISVFSICSSSTQGGPFSGIAVQGAGKHQIQKNAITGGSQFNGSSNAPSGPAIFILTSSNNNTILQNNVEGNFAGISVSGVSNVIQANQALGSFGIFGSGADIVDDNPLKSNTYLNNLCQTSVGAGAPMCPRLPAGLIGNPIVLQNSQN